MLANHDLEIRGAGDLLGDNQSGQIREIGFNLYHDLLKRTIDAMHSGKKLTLMIQLTMKYKLILAYHQLFQKLIFLMFMNGLCFINALLIVKTTMNLKP